MLDNKVLCKDIIFGGDKIPFIGGPCVIESRDHILKMAEEILKITEKLNVPFIFDWINVSGLSIDLST